MYAYIYIYIYVRISSTYIYIYIYMHVYVYVRVSVRIYIYVHMCMYILVSKGLVPTGNPMSMKNKIKWNKKSSHFASIDPIFFLIFWKPHSEI